MQTFVISIVYFRRFDAATAKQSNDLGVCQIDS